MAGTSVNAFSKSASLMTDPAAEGPPATPPPGLGGRALPRERVLLMERVELCVLADVEEMFDEQELTLSPSTSA